MIQKTNFWFEAIVHDDTSADNSVAIIREYAKKHPDIIKSENQYRKGSLCKIIDNGNSTQHSVTSLRGRKA